LQKVLDELGEQQRLIVMQHVARIRGSTASSDACHRSAGCSAAMTQSTSARILRQHAVTSGKR
jgi:hypothetical protein